MANNLAGFNSEQWSQRLVSKIDQVNVMLPLVNRNWEGDLRQNKTAIVRTPGSISMGAYSRGTIIAYQDLTPTKESFTVNDGQYFAFQVDDIDKAQSDISAMDVYMKRAVVSLNNKVEEKLLTAYTSVPVANRLGADVAGATGAILTPVIANNVITSVTVTNGGTSYTVANIVGMIGDGNGWTGTLALNATVITSVTITSGGNNYNTAQAVITSNTAVSLTNSTLTASGIYPLFTRMGAILDNNNVPADSGRWAIIDPNTNALLQNDVDHFIRATEMGDQIVTTGMVGGETVARNAANAPGFVGQIAGFNVFKTPHVPKDGSNNRYLLFGDPDAISYAAQITEIEALRLQTTFANAVRGLLLHDIFVPAESSKRLGYIKVAPAA